MEPEVASAMAALGASVKKLEEDLAPYFAQRLQWEQALEVDDRARLEVMNAYAVVAAYFAYLRVSNLPVDDAFHRTLSTVHEYLHRVKDVEEIASTMKGKGARRLRINKEAVKRLGEKGGENDKDSEDPPAKKRQ